jgi:uncharacterized protein YqjF (DUF2071 family)
VGYAGILLHQVAHRPWPLPTRPWVLRQRWHDLLFAHWPLPAEAVRRVLPQGLELDSFDGDAWISVVAFRMTGVTLRWCPPLPGVSSFPELNVRTYVRVGNRAGVYFFSLDAGSRVAVAVARAWFHLPYHHARMSVTMRNGAVRYFSVRRDSVAADFVAEYQPAGPKFRAQPGTLDHWLTERYCLYAADVAGRVHRGDIHHLPWPLQRAEAEITCNTMAPRGIALPASAPRLQFADALDVVAWAPTSMSS